MSNATVRDKIEARFSRLLGELRQNTSQKVAQALLPMLNGRMP
jgi:hypothetical protein